MLGLTACRGAAEVGSHGYDLDERAEILRVAGVERQASSTRDRCKEEVDGARPSRLVSRGYHSGNKLSRKLVPPQRRRAEERKRLSRPGAGPGDVPALQDLVWRADRRQARPS